MLSRARLPGLIALPLFLLLLFLSTPASAEGLAPPGGRFEYTPVSGKVRVWALKAWSNYAALCEIYRPDEFPPTNEDIRAYCGEEIYTQWVSAPPCANFIETGSSATCSGSFFTYLGYYERDYSTYVSLPESSVSLSMLNCAPGQWCDQRPVLTIEGLEPLPDFKITEIHIKTGNKPQICYLSQICKYQIPITTNQGVWIEYWAVSSFGDESEHGSLHIRNLYRAQNGGEYLVDMLSPDSTQDYAALTWDVFPVFDHPNQALYTIPQDETALFTDYHLYYLAGRLISSGQVDASECPKNGLLDNFSASACGEAKTYPLSLKSQNQYDRQLAQAGATYGIPPRLVKAIITQESQTWAGASVADEYGLGSLSLNAADLLLTWDPRSFITICSRSYAATACSLGYANLLEPEKSMLRSLALRPVGTQLEIDLITRVVRANVAQVSQMMYNLTGKPLSYVSTYEDLWDFTLANYHTGNQCIAAGIETLVKQTRPLNFANYCSLVTTCPTACAYVERVKNYASWPEVTTGMGD